MISPNIMWNMAVIAATASLVTSLVIVYTERWHSSYSLDKDLNGTQKVHKSPVPRVGGIALFMGILAVLIFDNSVPSNSFSTLFNESAMLILAAMPVFVAGLIEDLSKNTSVRARFLAAFASALAAAWMLGAYLPRLNTWGLDSLLQITPIAIVFTTFAVAGVTNSINIIDGFNGLAASVAIIILTSLGILGYQIEDVFITKLAVIGIGTTVGFLIVNYPTGRIFMGDGGAYLIGFWIAEITVLMIVRNPMISSWQLLAICAYPVIEVLYSIYRRKLVRSASPGNPDRLHLHTLVYRRFVCPRLRSSFTQTQPWIRNAMVVCVIVPFVAVMALLSVRFGGTTAGGISLVLIQGFLYLALYARLVRGHWCTNPVVGFGFKPEHRTKTT